MRILALAPLALAVLSGVVAAQAPRATLPFVTLDGQLGGAYHPGRSGERYYRRQSFGAARIAVAVRLGSPAAFRPVAVVDYLVDFGIGDQVSDCPTAPNGTCKAYFPDFSGVAVGLGVRRTLGSVITLGLTGGVGRYKLEGSETLTGFHADLELALRFMKHAGLVANVRHVETGKYLGAPMWFRPVTVGLRIQ